MNLCSPSIRYFIYESVNLLPNTHYTVSFVFLISCIYQDFSFIISLYGHQFLFHILQKEGMLMKCQPQFFCMIPFEQFLFIIFQNFLLQCTKHCKPMLFMWQMFTELLSVSQISELKEFADIDQNCFETLALQYKCRDIFCDKNVCNSLYSEQ